MENKTDKHKDRKKVLANENLNQRMEPSLKLSIFLYFLLPLMPDVKKKKNSCVKARILTENFTLNNILKILHSQS